MLLYAINVRTLKCVAMSYWHNFVASRVSFVPVGSKLLYSSIMYPSLSLSFFHSLSVSFSVSVCLSLSFSLTLFVYYHNNNNLTKNAVLRSCVRTFIQLSVTTCTRGVTETIDCNYYNV